MILVVLNPLESPRSKPHNNPKVFFFFFMGHYKWVGLLGLGQITSNGSTYFITQNCMGFKPYQNTQTH
jgi:hypothetical protein